MDGSERERRCCPGSSEICGEDIEDLSEGLRVLPLESTMGDELDLEREVERDVGGALLSRREKVKVRTKNRAGGVILTKMGTAATIQRGLPTVKFNGVSDRYKISSSER